MISTGKTLLSVAMALVMVVASVRVLAATDPREIKAREDFAAGRYQEAADQFARLYAETLHPNYLRNIGRCYQNLGEPDRAISSFRDYLRKGKSIHSEERKEVEGYISEMEELKRQRESSAAAARPHPEPVAAPTKAPEPVTPLVEAPKPVGTAPSASLVLTPPPPAAPSPPAESSPVYRRWWFWAIVGGVIAAGVGGAAAAGVFTRTQDAPCAGGIRC